MLRVSMIFSPSVRLLPAAAGSSPCGLITPLHVRPSPTPFTMGVAQSARGMCVRDHTDLQGVREERKSVVCRHTQVEELQRPSRRTKKQETWTFFHELPAKERHVLFFADKACRKPSTFC